MSAQPRPKIHLPTLPPGVTFSRGRASVTYSYAIEKFPAEKGVYSVILIAISVIVFQYFSIEYYTKLAITGIIFAFIIVVPIVYDYTSWGNGKLEVSFATMALLHRQEPKKGHVTAPPSSSIPLKNIAKFQLESIKSPNLRSSKPSWAFNVVNKTGETVSLFQSPYAKILFLHLQAMAQAPEVQQIFPGLKFETP